MSSAFLKLHPRVPHKPSSGPNHPAQKNRRERGIVPEKGDDETGHNKTGRRGSLGRFCDGAIYEARTRHLHLGKVELYQKSESRIKKSPNLNSVIFQTVKEPLFSKLLSRGFGVFCGKLAAETENAATKRSISSSKLPVFSDSWQQT